ncbi:transcription termination factor MTEF1, chloroplastic-like [Carex rostrata]
MQYLCVRLASPPPPPPQRRSHRTLNSLSTTSPEISPAASFNRTVNYLAQTLNINPHRALNLNPSLRSHPLPSLQFTHSLLLSIGLSPSQITRIFSILPLLLTHPIQPSVHFLQPLFHPHQLPTTISRCPRLLLCPVRTQLSPAIHFLRSLGIPVTVSSSLLLMADVESTLLPKVQFLQTRTGIPFYEVKYILKRFPRILTFSIDNNLEPKIDFLENDMKLDVATEIKKFPQYFAFSLENKIKRRHCMLRENGIRMSLEEMLRPSDGGFEQIILDMKLQTVDDIIRHKALHGISEFI